MFHLFDTNELTFAEVEHILARARYWEHNEHQPLTGRFVANLFFEASTRTRFSFEVAEKRLGCHVLNFAQEFSSTQKGETLIDTVKTLSSIGVEVVVIRHTIPNMILDLIKGDSDCAIINAGAGKEAHPTQALLDLYTMLQHFGNIKGKRVVIIGDIAHSRVVRSNIFTLQLFGAEVYVSGPEIMRDSEVEQLAAYIPLQEAFSTADVVMMLRVQLERHNNHLMQNEKEYLAAYGLNLEREKLLKKDAIIMHPAPFNRGVEIADEMVDHPRSKIFAQVRNGLYVRMALLERAFGEDYFASNT